jgi:4-hydroxy-tetrahydrodipicolinate synthase
MRLHGIVTALITPFQGPLVDVDALRHLVSRQIEAGVHGLVACGTTGETPALTGDEWALVVRSTVEEAAGRVPVLAGTGTNNTDETVRRTRLAKELHADAALVVTPYYSRPQQDGMAAHFARVAAEGGLPIVVYNVPSRTGVNLLPATAVRLSAVPGIVGLKEAAPSPSQVRDVVAGARPGFAVLSGDDALFLPSLAVGACGLVSVAGNVAPRPLVALWDAWCERRIVDAAAIDRSLAPLYAALFLEASPAPVKAAAAMLGICQDAVRLPLVPAGAATRAALADALAAANVHQEPVGKWSS